MKGDFAWAPGVGIDADALARLRAHFPRPRQAMGEAWFMGERRMFAELLGDLDALSARELHEPLFEIASGTGSFGPMEEWHAWYHYLLGQLLPRAHEAWVYALLESLLSGFFAQYPHGVETAPYPQFQDDVLATLGRCMMEPSCWTSEGIVLGRFLHRSNRNPNEVWMWWDASGDLSASLFFCMKYLLAPQVRPWFRSALEITAPHWRAQMMVWLVGAHDMLSAPDRWPSELSIGAYPAITWEVSYSLSAKAAAQARPDAVPMGSWLPDDARTGVLEVAKAYFSEAVFLEWLQSIDSDDALKRELADIPATFEQLYVGA